MTMSFRLLLGLFLAVVLAISITWWDRRAFGPRARQKGPDYTSGLSSLLLIYWVLLLLGTIVLNRGGRLTDTFFSLCFILFWQLSLYNLLLLALLPLLRRWFKPQTCALLWLLPIYLYVLQYDAMAPSHPRLIHILRRDCLSKFCFAVCTALCWFNPLMWLAMSRSAQDMELSCDEVVLSDATPATRRTYAGLLLDTAGDPRGFTTCLSASASALRYRLKRIVKPARRLAGGLLAGAAAFGLVMTSGFLSLAYETVPGTGLLFPSGCHEDYSLRSVSLSTTSSSDAEWNCADPDALLDYLAGLGTLQDTSQ